MKINYLNMITLSAVRAIALHMLHMAQPVQQRSRPTTFYTRIINQKFNLFFTRPLPLSGHVVRPNSSWFPINQMFWWTLPAIAAPAEVATVVVYVPFDMENGTFSICSFAPSDWMRQSIGIIVQ